MVAAPPPPTLCSAVQGDRAIPARTLLLWSPLQRPHPLWTLQEHPQPGCLCPATPAPAGVQHSSHTSQQCACNRWPGTHLHPGLAPCPSQLLPPRLVVMIACGAAHLAGGGWWGGVMWRGGMPWALPSSTFNKFVATFASSPHLLMWGCSHSTEGAWGTCGSH